MPARAAKLAPGPSWCVYMLRCGDGTLYTGATNRLEARVKTHSAGKGARYTRVRLPVKLVFHESAPDRSGALSREYALKQLSRSEKLALVRSVPKKPRKRVVKPQPRR